MASDGDGRGRLASGGVRVFTFYPWLAFVKEPHMRILLIDPPFQRFMGFYRYYYPLGRGRQTPRSVP